MYFLVGALARWFQLMLNLSALARSVKERGGQWVRVRACDIRGNVDSQLLCNEISSSFNVLLRSPNSDKDISEIREATNWRWRSLHGSGEHPNIAQNRRIRRALLHTCPRKKQSSKFYKWFDCKGKSPVQDMRAAWYVKRSYIRTYRNYLSDLAVSCL